MLAPVAAALAAGSSVFDLEIGDAERKGRQVAVVLDGITDTSTGELLTPRELAERLGDTRILFIGEDHTDMDFHRVQARVLEELHRTGREVMVGLEMFPYTRQDILDEWGGGSLTEEEFVESSDWYGNWGYRWDYYRRIFLFARDNGIPMFAVNIPRDQHKLDSGVALRKQIAGYDWGDSAVLRLERDGEVQSLDLHFRRYWVRR